MIGLLLGQVVTDVSISDQTAGTAILFLGRVVTDVSISDQTASVLKQDLNTQKVQKNAYLLKLNRCVLRAALKEEAESEWRGV